MAWRFTKERFDELLADGRITFGLDGQNMPRLKRFLSETQEGLVPTTWWAGDEVGTTDRAKKQLRKLFPDLIPFETPKPEELAARVIQIATKPGDFVLDCYAGSGTTPAVAHKMARQWIAVEREDRTFDEFLLPRIKRVVDGEQGGVSRTSGWTGGGSFRLIEVSQDLQAAGEVGAPASQVRTTSVRCRTPSRSAVRMLFNGNAHKRTGLAPKADSISQAMGSGSSVATGYVRPTCSAPVTCAAAYT
jgi:hypothetical protein